MHSEQNDLGVQVRPVPGSRIPESIRRPHTILCSATLGVVWVENDSPHEDTPNPEGSGEGNREVDQSREEADTERKIPCEGCGSTSETVQERVYANDLVGRAMDLIQKNLTEETGRGNQL